MKKLSLALLALLLVLASCARPSPYGMTAPTDGVVLRAQYPVYDKSIERIYFTLENATNGELYCGADWTLERAQGGGWTVVPFAPDTGFESPLYRLEPGARRAFCLYTVMLADPLTDGDYRIVKEAGDDVCFAEFSVGESDVTARSPNGFAPLEDMIDGYYFNDARDDGVVMLTSSNELVNASRVTDFIEHASIGLPDTLRVGRLAADGSLALADVVYGGAYDSFTLRARDASGSDGVSEAHYGYLVTDGERLCVSPDSYYSERAVAVLDVVPGGEWTELLGRMSDAAEGASRYFSPDGNSCVGFRRGGLEYWLAYSDENGSSGMTHSVADMMDCATAIREVVWRDYTYMLVCDTAEEDAALAPLTYYEMIDAGTAQVAWYTTSRLGYAVDAYGNIQILE